MTLRKVANIRENHIPGDEKYKFRERASEILKSWKSLFAEDLVNGLRWIRFGQNSLVYVPSDDSQCFPLLVKLFFI